MYDLIIIGAGPAGTAAGVYAARKKLKTLLLTEDFGGQSIVSETIYNWIGSPEISGSDLAKNFKDHIEYYAEKNDISVIKNKVIKIDKKEDGTFIVSDSENNEYKTKSILLATGSLRRKLTVKGAEKFEHKGITYCASCDGPLFSDKNVIVVGGGNAGFETAAQLLAYTKSVTLLQRGDTYRADKITVEKVLSHPNMTGITNTEVIEIDGDTMVNKLIYKDKKTGEIKEIETGGIFVEIGQIPNTNIVKDIVKLNDSKQVEIDPWSQRTSQTGIWAAGDTTNVKYHQNNIAAGDAVKALEDIYMFLQIER